VALHTEGSVQESWAFQRGDEPANERGLCFFIFLLNLDFELLMLWANFKLDLEP